MESPALHALRRDVQDQLIDVATLPSTLLQAAQSHYPCAPPAPRRPDQPVELANSARHMWGIFREMRKQQFSARGIVTAWRLWVQFQRAYQIHKQRSRERIRQKRDDLLEQANTAAHSGNLFGLWRVVKQLAPKAPRKRLQLHQEGRILSTDEEPEVDPGSLRRSLWGGLHRGHRYTGHTVFTQACPDLSEGTGGTIEGPPMLGKQSRRARHHQSYSKPATRVWRRLLHSRSIMIGKAIHHMSNRTGQTLQLRFYRNPTADLAVHWTGVQSEFRTPSGSA